MTLVGLKGSHWYRNSIAKYRSILRKEAAKCKLNNYIKQKMAATINALKNIHAHYINNPANTTPSRKIYKDHEEFQVPTSDIPPAQTIFATNSFRVSSCKNLPGATVSRRTQNSRHGWHFCRWPAAAVSPWSLCQGPAGLSSSGLRR